ncbi:hypothetical protein BJX65DRAFT_287898 [Aspergillus insuetus]
MTRHGCGPRRRRQRQRQQSPLEMANGYLAAVTNLLWRVVQFPIAVSGLYNLSRISREESRFLTLPPEIRLLIYEYVLGYRTVHIETGEDIGWHYFVCRGENGTHFELAVGEVWAARGRVPSEGDGDDDGEDKSWKDIIPACRFAYRSSCGAVVRNCNSTRWFIEAKSEKDSRELLLNLNLLSVNKLIYLEAAELVYRTTIFAFREVDAFRDFADKDGELASHVQNLVLYIEPMGRRMHLWNEWLREQTDPNYNEEELLRVFSNVQKLQIVVGGSKPLDEQCSWTVYGLLALSKLEAQKISVDVSLCSENGEGAEQFARIWERKLQRSWDDEAEREMRELEAEYASSPLATVNSFLVEGSCCVFPG